MFAGLSALFFLLCLSSFAVFSVHFPQRIARARANVHTYKLSCAHAHVCVCVHVNKARARETSAPSVKSLYVARFV